MGKFRAFVNNWGMDILGLLQVTAALVAGSNGLIPIEQVPKWLIASGILSAIYSRLMPHVAHQEP